MIDHLDKQTQPLPLEPKRGRGRPATGQALSSAERQRAYRERQKAQRNEKPKTDGKEAQLREALEQVYNRVLELEDLVREKNKTIEKLKAELQQRNEKPARVKRHRDQPAAELPDDDVPDIGVWTVQFKPKGQRTWISCDPQIDFEGRPWDYRMTRQHVMDMQKAAYGNHWRAVRNDGLVYDPKALKEPCKPAAKL